MFIFKLQMPVWGSCLHSASLSVSKWGCKATFLKMWSFGSQNSGLKYMGKTLKNFKAVLFILGLSLIHKENGVLAVKGFLIAV